VSAILAKHCKFKWIVSRDWGGLLEVIFWYCISTYVQNLLYISTGILYTGGGFPHNTDRFLKHCIFGMVRVSGQKLKQRAAEDIVN
jgi:hypothetical protein